MAGVRVVAWERADGQRGHSTARIERTDRGWTCHGSEVVAGPADVLSCHFRIEVDGGWRTRRAEVTAVAADVTSLLLTADDARRWTRDGVAAPEFAGCVDVDVAATPLTNTLPIRRHPALPVGESVTLAVAWIEVPSLTVSRVEQTYTRLGEHRWRYHDDTYGSFELIVDADGVVVDYAGFATRVRP